MARTPWVMAVAGLTAAALVASFLWQRTGGAQ